MQQVVVRPIVHSLLRLGLLMCMAGSSFAQQQSAAIDAPEPITRAPGGPGRTAGLALDRYALAPPIPAQAASAAGELAPSVDDDHVGSTGVPMDSWIYPALERLGSLGLISSQSVGIRPWTRGECRRQLREAESILGGFDSLDVTAEVGARDEAARLLPDLERELREPDGASTVVLESAYARVGVIAGPALTDGFHFGQTWSNDFGRPLGRGTSAIAGYAARAVSGRLFLYSRQELQTDPGLPALTQARADLFNSLDNIPFQPPGTPTPAGALISPAPAIAGFVRTRPIELYAGIAFAGNAVSFGKQEIYWGPTTMGSFSFSSNAEPTYNLRLLATRPHPFPLVPDLGSYRFDLIFGKLSGHQHPARPYYNGQKITLNFGGNLEVSATRWSILWGVNHPITLGTLKNNLFSANSTGNGLFGDRTDPGDRKSAFDFRLHVPGISHYLTLYADSYADDEPNPLSAPRRQSWSPGLYLARLPRLPHADLRFEMASSEELARDEGGTRVFINNQYRDGNTNKGFLLGNAVGRDARAFEGRVGYWISARTRVEGAYRQTKGGRFLPGGSTISDAFGNVSYGISEGWRADLFAQYERFLVPSYLPGAQRNGSARIQITWTPHTALFAR